MKDNTTMSLDESIRCFWFIGGGDETFPANYIQQLHETDNGYELHWRIRYYVDDKAHDSSDIKVGDVEVLPKHIDGEDALQTYLDIFDERAKRMVEDAKPSRVDLYRLERNADADFDNFLEEFMQLPFVHAKTIEKEELQ